MLSRIFPQRYPYELDGIHRRIYHYHIQKTGGTSVNYAFCALAYTQDLDSLLDESIISDVNETASPGMIVKLKLNKSRSQSIRNNELLIVGPNLLRLNMGRYFYGFSHYPMKWLWIPENAYTFTILRDPVQRILSRFKHTLRLKHSGKLHRHPPLRQFADLTQDDLREFVIRLDKRYTFHQLYMFSTQFEVDEALENIASCNRVLFTESLTSGFEALKEELNLPLQVGHAKKSSMKLSLADEDRAWLQEYFQPEYEFIAEVRNLPNLASSSPR